MNLDPVYEVANMVGMGHESDLLVAAESRNPLVRYWAVIGLRNVAELSAAGRETLRGLMDDDSPTVRVEAAAALARAGETGRPLELLATELRDDNQERVLRAARQLELLGEVARPTVEVMKEVHPQWMDMSRGSLTLFINFSLDASLKRFGEEGGMIDLMGISSQPVLK